MAGQLKLNGVTLATEENGVLSLESPEIKDSSNNVILEQSGTKPVLKNVEVVNDSPLMFRNRIINGDMRIDQRNSGGSITPSTTYANVYTVDRWNYRTIQASKFSFQQNAGSVIPPSGFSNYLGCTVVSSHSVAASDYFIKSQVIEGFNISDLGWGTADAKSVTLSFWVMSSLTGQFGLSLRNGSVTRSYPFLFSISSANTWEFKTITISGDTSGTWDQENGAGIILAYDLGSGSSFKATSGAWTSGNFHSATGATSVVGTNGATFYITGVQLEAGTVATPFERRLIGTELALCQRYYFVFSSQGYWFFPPATSDPNGKCNVMFKQTMRANPTCTATKTGGGTAVISFDSASVEGAVISLQGWGNNAAQLQSLTASAEL